MAPDKGFVTAGTTLADPSCFSASFYCTLQQGLTVENFNGTPWIQAKHI